MGSVFHETAILTAIKNIGANSRQWVIIPVTINFPILMGSTKAPIITITHIIDDNPLLFWHHLHDFSSAYCGSIFIINKIGFNGNSYILSIRFSDSIISSLTLVKKNGDSNSCQDSNDEDNHQKLNQGKSASLLFLLFARILFNSMASLY
jgi:hypothetical protein